MLDTSLRSRANRSRTEPEIRTPVGRPTAPVTVIVPAFNEAAHVADTIRSLQEQTVAPEEIIVVDDCSTDRTGDVGRALGVRVVRPPVNTGSKAGAQTYALGEVTTIYAIAVDADTTLAPDALEHLLDAMEDEGVAAACGFVVPRRVRSVWERGRYIEYLYAFTFVKPIQDHYGKPLISSGCLSIYRTEDLRAIGGWSDRTLAEDMDLTWTLYDRGRGVRFVPEAVCYPVEPRTARLMRAQLRRWSHGFVQNVRLHWRRFVRQPYLRSMVAVGLWDAILAPLFFFIGLPLLAALVSPYFLLGYVIDAPVVVVPVMTAAVRRREAITALASVPSFFFLRLVNGVFMLSAMWQELVLRRSFHVYEKGH